MKCTRCKAQAIVGLPSHNAAFCAECYLDFFSRQVDKGIQKGSTSEPLFDKNDRILMALSGGKDSLAAMLELARQGYNVTGLHLDLAIGQSSQAARTVVESFCAKHSLALQIVETAKEGLPIPLVKEKLKRPICSACGKIKRHYFNRAALEGNYTVLATGHNLDDEVARLFSNVLRWDASYLGEQGPMLPAEAGFARKVKPLWRLSEFETANYAFLKDIEHHVLACPFSSGASFTLHKKLWNDLEHAMPGKKLSFYLEFLEHGRKHFAPALQKSESALSPCPRCGYPTSTDVCGVCRIREAVRA